MKIVDKSVKDIIPYENNPRFNDEAVEPVAESIREFGFKVPIVIDKNNIIVAGHTRLKAALLLGLDKVPCIVADDLTDAQIKAYRLADNKVGEFATWNDELMLQELQELDALGVDMLQFGFIDFDFETFEESSEDETVHKSLNERFVVPPFSVLDTRQGYWQDRKKAWIEQGVKSNKGRSQNLTNAVDKSDYMKTGCKGIAVQTSIFDPVLCEIMYKWFNINGGKIFDCFAGGSVRGIIAEKLGYKYQGIDLRQEQIDENKKQAEQMGLNPQWYCDDSLNADKYIEDNSCDMIFTCPPYADLEVYSDDKRDISNMDYEQFCDVYAKILSIACRKLKDNRFAVIVIGDVRDKKGAYRQLVDYTRKILTNNGLQLYNDFVLVEQVGTGAIRAPKQFNALRKAIKVHQNVLVFYKGDIKKIKENFEPLDLSENDIKGLE